MVGILQSWMRKDGKRIMAKKKAVRRENGRGTVEKTNSKKNVTVLKLKFRNISGKPAIM